jgi:hypothetical protein
MARVAEFFDLEMDDPRLHPTAVDCGVKSFEIGDETFLQLSTYGSSDRKGSGVSQTLQLDVTAAAYLMGVLRRTFPQLS